MGSVGGSPGSTARAGQRATGEGWLTSFAIWNGHCSLRMLLGGSVMPSSRDRHGTVGQGYAVGDVARHLDRGGVRPRQKLVPREDAGLVADGDCYRRLLCQSKSGPQEET